MNNVQDFEILSGVLCRYHGQDTVITIPEGVREIGSMVFEENTIIQKVFLPRSVIRIGEGAFRGCKNLEEIHLSEDLLIIDDRAFYGCEALEEVCFPERLQSIGAKAFLGCLKLKTISLPESVQSLGEAVFATCRALTSIRLPSGLEEIPREAFRSCSSLVDIQFPTSLRSIGDSAFIYTKDMKLRLPESLQTIASRAFESTGNFNVIFPKHFSSLPKYLFDYAGDYEIFAPGVPFQTLAPSERKAAVAGYVKAPEDMLALLPKREEEQYIAFLQRYRRKYYPRIADNEALLAKMIEHTLIPYEETEELLDLLQDRPDLVSILLDYIQSIKTPEMEKKMQRKKEREADLFFSLRPPTISEMRKEWTFDLLEDDTCILRSYKGNDTEIVIPEFIGRYRVIALADYALSPFGLHISARQSKVRKAITSIVIPDTVETLGKNLCFCCLNLQTVTLPADIKVLPPNVFSHCEKLTTIRLPENLEAIFEYAFIGCKQLADVHLPDGITEIDMSAFFACPYSELKVKAESITRQTLDNLGFRYKIID